MWKNLTVSRAIALIVGVYGLLGVGCSSTPVADNEALSSSASPVPQSVPRNADFVMRAEPDWMQSFLGRQTTQHGRLSGSSDVRWLLPNSLEYLIESIEPVLTETMAPYVDHEEAIWFTASWEGADEIMANLERGITPDYLELLAVAGHMRLAIPITDAEQARGDIDAECGLEMRRCGAIRSVSSEGSYILFDFGLLPNQQINRGGEERQSEWLLGRDTPAARAFFEDDGPLAIYTTTDRLVGLKVLDELQGTLDTIDFGIDSPSSWYRALSEMVAAASIQSARATEYEDLAVTIGRDDDKGGYFADVHQSHSARGIEVFEARQAPVNLPSVQVRDPAIRVEWLQPSASTLSQAVVPEWMSNETGSQPGPGQHQEMIFRGGRWSPYIPLWSYPMAWIKGLWQFESSELMDFDQVLGALGLMEPVVAMRAAFDVNATQSGDAPFGLEGGLAIAVNRESSASEEFRKIIESAEQGGALDSLGLHISERDQGPHRLFMIGSGDHDETFGEAGAVDNLRFGVDVDALHAAAADTPMGPTLSELASMIPQLAITRRVEAGGVVTRHDLGRVDGVTPTSFGGSAPPRDLARGSDCVYDAHRESRAHTLQILIAEEHEQGAAIQRGATQMAEIIEACQAEEIGDDESENLSATAAYWANLKAEDIALADSEERQRQLEQWREQRRNEASD